MTVGAVADDWGRRHRFHLSLQTTPSTTGGTVADYWGAVTAVIQLRRQLREPSLPSLLRCVLIRIWGCHHPSLPKTGGPIATVVHLHQQLGEGLLPLPTSSVSTKDWGIRCRRRPSPLTTGGAVIDVAAFL
jgi:hypothetical protein